MSRFPQIIALASSITDLGLAVSKALANKTSNFHFWRRNPPQPPAIPRNPPQPPATINSQTYPRWDILRHFTLGTLAFPPGQNRNKPASSAEKMSKISISVHGSPRKSTEVHRSARRRCRGSMRMAGLIGRNRTLPPAEQAPGLVAQVSKPAVSPTSKSAARVPSCGWRVGKPATQQTWKSALRGQCPVAPGLIWRSTNRKRPESARAGEISRGFRFWAGNWAGSLFELAQ